MMFLLLGTFSYGQATSNRDVDYGEAISQLIKLGFPDVKGARYVNVKDQSLKYSQRGFSSSSQSPKLLGNGFYIASNDKAKPGRFITLSGEELVFLKNRSRQSGMGGAVSGKMKDIDLKKDIEIVRKWVLKESINPSSRYRTSQNYSVAFGFANLAYQGGAKGGANELLKMLFLNHENPKQMIDLLISNIAKRDYMKSYSEFTETRDWGNYLAALKRLQSKYPRGWDNQPGLALLIPLVEKRVNNDLAEEPTVKGHIFSDEIKNLIKLTAKSEKGTENDYYGGGDLFLINEVAKNDKVPAMMQLTQYGMEGFIALVALIGDETLVVSGGQNNRYGYGGGYSYYSSSDGEGKSAEEAYSALTKPLTRGQMAEQLVKAVLPHNYQELNEVEGDQLRKLAIQWWREHREDEKLTLIKHYFEHGNQSHTMTLSRTLMNENTQESRELLEGSILSSANPENLSDLVKTYVKKRRQNSKEFVMKYQEVLLARIGESKEQGGEYNNYRIVEAGGTRKFIEGLLRYTEALKPDELFVKLSKKGTNATEVMEMLGSVYNEKDLPKVLHRFIGIAADTEDEKKQHEILSSLSRMMYPHQSAKGNIEGVESEKNEGEKQKVSFTDEEKKDWQVLLASKFGHGYMKTCDITGFILDKHVNPERQNDDYRAVYRLGQEALSELLKQRSEAFLSGTRVEPLPNVNLVEEKRKQEVMSLLNDVDPIDIREMYKGLSYSERLVIVGDPMSQQKFKDGAVYIKDFAGGDPGVKDKVMNVDGLRELCKDLLDREVGAETYSEVVNLVMANSSDFEGVMVSIMNGKILPGREIHFTKSTKLSYPEVDKLIEDVISGKLSSFTVMVASEQYGYGGRGGQKPIIFVYGKGLALASEKLEEITESHMVSITSVNKKVIREWELNQVDEKKEVIDELIQLQPSFEDMRSQFNDMELDRLLEVLSSMKGER